MTIIRRISVADDLHCIHTIAKYRTIIAHTHAGLAHSLSIVIS